MSSIEVLIEAESQNVQELIVQRVQQMINEIACDLDKIPTIEVTTVYGDTLIKIDPDGMDLTE